MISSFGGSVVLGVLAVLASKIVTMQPFDIEIFEQFNPVQA